MRLSTQRTFISKALKHARLSLCVLILSLLTAPVSAFAQTVKVTDINDFSLGSWSGSGDLQNEDIVCIYNLGVSTYRVRLTGTGAGGAFRMTGTGGDIPYEVEFKSGAGSFVALTANAYTGFSGANTVSNSCGGSPNATIRVTARAASLAAVLTGSYSDTLTILLETN